MRWRRCCERLLVSRDAEGHGFHRARRRAREDAARRPRTAVPRDGALDRPGGPAAPDPAHAGGGEMSSELKLTAKEFKSDQEVRWCPGCGDYAILAAVQSFMPELGL